MKVGNDVEYETVLFQWEKATPIGSHIVRDAVEELLRRKARDGWRLVGVTGNFPAREWWFSRDEQ
jgi:hypothetical protein